MSLLSRFKDIIRKRKFISPEELDRLIEPEKESCVKEVQKRIEENSCKSQISNKLITENLIELQILEEILTETPNFYSEEEIGRIYREMLQRR